MKRPPIPLPNFYPSDEAINSIPQIVECLVMGCVPDHPIIDKQMNIVAFGSCFADYVSRYLVNADYNVITKAGSNVAHIASMGDAFVNTFVILQQFEWAWMDKKPTVPLRYKGAWDLSEDIRIETKRLLDKTDVFILTLGLSEVWHGNEFRMATQIENTVNLCAIVRLIRRYRPDAIIVFTLSPVPLKMTFRSQSCLVANEASKASLRSAIDELMAGSDDKSLFYFPSYELVKNCFNHPYVRDRRHIYQHVVDFMMSVFDCYFCGGIPKQKLLERFNKARERDRKICSDIPQLSDIDDNMMIVAESDGRLDRSYRSVGAQH